MSCSHPITAYIDQYVFNPTGGKHIEFHPSIPLNRDRYKEIQLPCGKCIGCRLERSRQWATRMMHEAQYHDDNCFITLTYDDVHLPAGGTLVKKDFQDFMKRLRKAIYPGKVRYYACGEYGDKSGRAHYHAIIFGYAFPDRTFVRMSSKGAPIYYSELLASIWPLGIATVGDCTFDSCAYVAKYVQKKVNGADAKEHYAGRLPEFALMSRKPGIGAQWIEDHKSQVYPLDKVVSRGHLSKPPRFYDKVLQDVDPVMYDIVHGCREGEAVHIGLTTDQYDNTDRLRHEVWLKETQKFHSGSL